MPMMLGTSMLGNKVVSRLTTRSIYNALLFASIPTVDSETVSNYLSRAAKDMALGVDPLFVVNVYNSRGDIHQTCSAQFRSLPAALSYIKYLMRSVWALDMSGIALEYEHDIPHICNPENCFDPCEEPTEERAWEVITEFKLDSDSYHWSRL